MDRVGNSEQSHPYLNDPNYIRLGEVIKKFCSSANLNSAKTEQLNSIVSLYSAHFRKCYEKQYTRNKIAMTLISKGKEARRRAQLRKEFEEERKVLVEKLNEASLLIEKYTAKVKNLKTKSKKKTELMKHIIVDKDKELSDLEKELNSAKGTSAEYMAEFKGIASMSDQLMEQLAILEQQRLDDKKIVAGKEQEFKDTITRLQEQLDAKRSDSPQGEKQPGTPSGESTAGEPRAQDGSMSPQRSRVTKSIEKSQLDNIHTLHDQVLAVNKPSKSRKKRRSSSIRRVYENSSIVVAARIRPLSTAELEKDTAIVNGNNECDSVVLNEDWYDEVSKDRPLSKETGNTNKETRSYGFDVVFGADIDQNVVYALTGRHVLERFVSGYNGTIFAYGQTGSGKTYTMMGAPGRESVAMNDDTDGITPRLVRDLFAYLHDLESRDGVESQWKLSVTYIEIYMESIRDLLNPGAKAVPRRGSTARKLPRGSAAAKASIDIRETQRGTPYLHGAVEVNVGTFEHLIMCLNEGTLRRTTEETNSNATSSRSHSVLTLKLTVMDGAEATDPKRGTVTSKLHVVDLAGSENAASTDGISKLRRQEGMCINKSLLSLHRVIKSLTKGQQKARSRDASDKSLSESYIPYRSSKLTRLLKDSLGGNCFTLMICNLSPTTKTYGETKRSLAFSQSVKHVRNKAIKNIDVRAKRIRDLELENKKLRHLVGEYRKILLEETDPEEATAELIEEQVEDGTVEKAAMEEMDV